MSSKIETITNYYNNKRGNKNETNEKKKRRKYFNSFSQDFNANNI
jgi:hypothetical protein